MGKEIYLSTNRCGLEHDPFRKGQEILSNPYFVKAFQIDEQFKQFEELVLKPGLEFLEKRRELYG